MSLYDEKTKDNLDVVRSIRNAFAHTKIPLGFENKLISAELRKVKTPTVGSRLYKKWTPKIRDTKEGFGSVYVVLCMLLTLHLIRKETSMTRRSLYRMKRSTKIKYSKSLLPYLEALNVDLNNPPEPQINLLEYFQENHSAGPSQPAQSLTLNSSATS